MSDITDMNLKYLLYGFLLFMGAQLVAWVQVYGILIWPRLKANVWIVYVLAPVIAFFYIHGTRFIVTAYNGVVWPSRLIAFSAGILVFSILTAVFMKEGINLKTAVSIGLCIVILLIQILWKT